MKKHIILSIFGVLSLLSFVSIAHAFIPENMILSYTAGPNGAIIGDTYQVVLMGTDGTPVTAVPDVGYHFVDWSDGSTENPRTDTQVWSFITVTANFALNTQPPIDNGIGHKCDRIDNIKYQFKHCGQ